MSADKYQFMGNARVGAVARSMRMFQASPISVWSFIATLALGKTAKHGGPRLALVLVT